MTLFNYGLFSLPVARVIGFFWLIFIVYWIVSAFRAKKKVPTARGWRGGWWRLLTILLVFRLNRFSLFNHPTIELLPGLAAWFPFIRGAGGVLCALGLAFAIWARLHIGRNWGMPMSLQQDHELVTSGPYARVRHPIYTGILLALLGSALAEGLSWLILFILFFAYFVYSAKTEERLMTEQFPQAYPPYQSRTKMLLPFLW